MRRKRKDGAIIGGPPCGQRSVNNHTIKMPKNPLGIIQYSEIKKARKKKKPKALRGIR